MSKSCPNANHSRTNLGEVAEFLNHYQEAVYSVLKTLEKGRFSPESLEPFSEKVDQKAGLSRKPGQRVMIRQKY